MAALLKFVAEVLASVICSYSTKHAAVCVQNMQLVRYICNFVAESLHVNLDFQKPTGSHFCDSTFFRHNLTSPSKYAYRHFFARSSISLYYIDLGGMINLKFIYRTGKANTY